ncbi:hypothetical protein F4805DRAFT_329112 [Annulohypoxylon moriforme]|nr:hypothetical protein F4805DRAFT_329112 [Annulohypoxylon moriforme]
MRRYHLSYTAWLGSKDESLFTRAWPYQERLIAPRVLFFRKDELSFECFCQAACECGVTQHQVLRPLTSFYKKRFFEDVIKPSEEQAIQDQASNEMASRSTLPSPYYPDGEWRTVVNQYTDLEMEKEKDKLIALKAVSDEFQAIRPKEKYLFGLWSGSLHKDLLWWVVDNARKPLRRTSNLPTWSWATMFNRQAIYLRDLDENFVPTAEFKEPIVDNPLKIRGRLLPCWLVRGVDADGYQDEYLSLTGRLKLRASLQGSESVHLDDATNLLSGKLQRRVYLLEIAKSNTEISEDIYFLVLSGKEKEDHSEPESDPDEVSQPFIRAGLFHVYRMKPMQGWRRDQFRMKYMNLVLKIFGRIRRIDLY